MNQILKHMSYHKIKNTIQKTSQCIFYSKSNMLECYVNEKCFLTIDCEGYTKERLKEIFNNSKFNVIN